MAAMADETIPPTPKPTKTTRVMTSVDTTLHIQFSSGEKNARLVIPRNQLKLLRAQLDEMDDADNTAAVSSVSRIQTIVSGLFLSLAIIFGGVWFVRSGKTTSKKSKVLVIGAGLFLSGAIATIAFGNIGPPTRAEITSKIFNTKTFTHPLGLEGQVKLEVSSTSDRIEFIVPEVKEEEEK